ncbi:MAG: tetratricopeptide repeat protein, partial [Candidatus Riflebacteria bacterium]|nr:tetratricopeptide repeat protein [Candidatus Riflebacteria bacterium]
MKTSAKVTVQDGVFNVKFDIFEAVWGYLLYDNISLLADSKTNNLKLYSFLSGKEQTSADISKDNIEELSKSQIIEINYALGDNQTAVFKKEAIDITGKFIEAIEAQFKGKNATAIECYKAVLEANPNNYRAFGLLGRCYRTEGKMDEAYECYKKAIELA